MSMRNSNQEFTEMRANGSNNNNYFYNSEMREHMFDKVLTPSDVGKLNRLVIPKQHAENYFSLDDENQNETVLDFQDKNGKMWRFRYCYWNSSQSYVITRGWNRFVKEKKLIAGDIASFHRGYITDESEQRRKIMFIDWRHRVDINNINQHNYIFGSPAYLTDYSMPSYRSFPPFYQGREFLGYGYGRIVNGGRFYAGSPLDHHRLNRSEPLVYDSVPVFPMPTQPSTVKKLRLFGVDVEESSFSGETRVEMGVVGNSLPSPVVIRDDDQSSWRSPLGEMGASSSSVMQLSDDEEYKRKGKSSMF